MIMGRKRRRGRGKIDDSTDAMLRMVVGIVVWGIIIGLLLTHWAIGLLIGAVATTVTAKNVKQRKTNNAAQIAQNSHREVQKQIGATKKESSKSTEAAKTVKAQPRVREESAKEEKVIKTAEPKIIKNAGFELQKNQLISDVYIIGKDIPEGIYDFTLIKGNGYLKKFTSEKDSFETMNYSEYMGTHEWESEICIGVHCKEGEYLHVEGNVVIGIQKNGKVEID